MKFIEHNIKQVIYRHNDISGLATCGLVFLASIKSQNLVLKQNHKGPKDDLKDILQIQLIRSLSNNSGLSEDQYLHQRPQHLEAIYYILSHISEMLAKQNFKQASVMLQKTMSYIYEVLYLSTGVQNLGYPPIDSFEHSSFNTAATKCNACFRAYTLCAVCQQPVNGISVLCAECRHGGHLGHMSNWFKSEIECPSGCGCRCLILNYR